MSAALASGSLPIGLIAAALVLRAADALYHRDHERVLRHLRLVPHAGAREPYYRALDPVFAPMPFVWNWLELLGATALAVRLDHGLGYAALVVFAGARFRALQEVGHTAVHFGLCRRQTLQWGLSNVLFQYPCFKPDMRHRCVSHVQQHHRNANERRDPNIVRFESIGFVPGMSPARFRIMLFHSFRPAGFAETIRMAIAGASTNHSPAGAAVRGLAVVSVILVFLSGGGWKALVFGYVVPLVTVYPWFSWISLLVEHRWFVDCREQDRFARECINGRPTVYRGVSGWLIKHCILPATDHYHLAHSLHPHVRWNYIAAVDRVLAERDPRYGAFRSEGLLWSSGSAPSALSELRDRMTTNARSDLASWAAPLIRSTR